jgi:TonB family protein
MLSIMMRIALGVVTVAALALLGRAHAQPSVVDGGPKDSAALEAAAGKVAGALSVCWQGKRPNAVVVAVSVAASGEVRTAKAKTRGKVATCAAAVLAVHRLAAASKGYRATLSFPTSGGGGGGASVRDKVLAGVKNNRAVDACHTGKPKLTGRVNIRFLVKPNGRIVDVEANESTLSDAKVAACLVKEIGSTRLGALDTKRSVEFTLPFSFGGGAAALPTSGGSGDASLQPQKKGPLETDVLRRVMAAARSKFSGCYEAQLRNNPDLAGVVVLRYTIRANGTTRNVKIKKSTLDNAAVEACRVKVGERLKFPAQTGRAETRVVYPFRFAAASR